MIKRKGSSFVVAAIAAAASASALADSTYEMSSYLGWPSGAEIAESDYAGAIAIASRARSHTAAATALVAATNQCDAYTVTGALSSARVACDEAVALARSADRASLRRFPHETATAHALSNRGVLRAKSGDASGAAGDFQAATVMRGASPTPGRNLVHLRSSSSNRLAALEATTD
jgi:hypothetical protein